MGAVLAKFRKDQSTEKKLELLEEKIQTLEKFTYNTQEQKKRFVGTFLAVSVGIYVIAALAIIYFVYFPRTWRERLLYIVPLLIFPFLIIWLRRLFTWYFQRKLNKNADKLTTLREEKRKILDQVMNKETYKVAVNLLARFGGMSGHNGSRLSVGGQRAKPTPYTAAHQAALYILAAKPPNNQLAPVTEMPTAANQENRPTPSRPVAANPTQLIRTSQSITASPLNRADQQLRRRTPFPIVNQADKSFLERCLDIIIGDGPQDRFAIICRECHSHNGMALKEEFDYIAYRCAFCNAMNPARKTRPIAPRLSIEPASESAAARLRAGDSSASTTTSESSGDESAAGGKRKRRVQLRLTESTANQSESNEITNHEINQTAAVNAPVQQTHEPMDGVEEDDASIFASTLPSTVDHTPDIIEEDSSNNDDHKKVE